VGGIEEEGRVDVARMGGVGEGREWGVEMEGG